MTHSLPEFRTATTNPASGANSAFPGIDAELTGLSNDPEWYKTAVFYEVIVRAFADSTGSGTGDLRGLIGRLDYLRWLGVDCLWLPPFYPSPLRDGGYDVADYTSIAPQLGSMEDFQELITEAHRRGIRIVIDLVMNHTSDQHPWFQASRTDPEGPYGDFYVRRQYFWHGFFHHQPDLNFENPAVQEAMLGVARFWCEQGVDGFRLDAVPYLFEADGTNCENLPETHAFLARLRNLLDTQFPGRIMLAEANQWPEDVIHYYGTEEAPECHMCFHFPVMPRIYYAIKDGRSKQIADILDDTPALVGGQQWGTFLRNHDELTLEMVSTEERASMYRWFASDPRMRANVGIRRRLAPLLDNSRKEIELANALLLSLPGSPCLYYGDEIGMGDNIWLNDRDSVRTPMQWTPDRNAGFSTADPGKLYLPVVQSLVYNYRNANVEAQLEQPTSLLHWTRGMLAVRRQHPAFGTGDFANVECDNESIFAYLRRSNEETILCVANFAATARRGTLSLQQYAGQHLIDLFGGADLGTITGEGDFEVMLGSREFLWLSVQDGPASTN
jgi:maltose alpha-D-glucosyltransferase/alpha-amylase